MKTRVSIIGASGYTGVELVRLLLNHPAVSLKQLVTQRQYAATLDTLYPHLAQAQALKLTQSTVQQVAESSDLIFLALPHTQSISWAIPLLESGCRVIDLSADFRLKSGQVYQKYYQAIPAPQNLLKMAVYGLPEITDRSLIATAQLVANPGCYATAALLGAAPLMVNQCLDTYQSLIIDAKSGVSGAGRHPSSHTHFCEVVDNLSAYAIGEHRHLPEILQQLETLRSDTITASLKLQFTPHLLAIPRGLMATLYLPLKTHYSLTELVEKYQHYYHNAPFIQVRQGRERVGLKSILGSNFATIDLYLNNEQSYLIAICCIDNLLKGAAGQAVQNMNLMLQLPQDTGLKQLAIYP